VLDSCLIDSAVGDSRAALGEPVLPSCDNLGRFEELSSGVEDCLRFARGDLGASGSTGRITAEDIGLGILLASELVTIENGLPHTVGHCDFLQPELEK
jgi:hypothetical protein